MDNIKVIHVENFEINNKFVISVDCRINYKLYSVENLQHLFKTQVAEVISNNSLQTDELIILVNYADINPKNVSMKKIKSIINLMCNEFPYILHKCIFYNIIMILIKSSCFKIIINCCLFFCETIKHYFYIIRQ